MYNQPNNKGIVDYDRFLLSKIFDVETDCLIEGHKRSENLAHDLDRLYSRIAPYVDAFMVCPNGRYDELAQPFESKSRIVSSIEEGIDVFIKHRAMNKTIILYKIIEHSMDDQVNYKFRYALIDND
jgi:hypothetical protein